MSDVNVEGSTCVCFKSTKFVIHPICPDDKCIEDYKKPDSSIEYKFRLPAINPDEHNDDGYKKMYQLICCNGIDELKVESVEQLLYDTSEVFADTKNNRVLYVPRIMQMQRTPIIGKNGVTYEILVARWRYRVSAIDECPWL